MTASLATSLVTVDPSAGRLPAPGPLPPSLFPSSLTAHEQAGFELGWDYAHHRLTPPSPYAHEPSALKSGLLAGRAAFGSKRTLVAHHYVRQWLQLRLHAWLRGRAVELMQVTPNYLRQIDAAHCPITRVALAGAGGEAVVAPVRPAGDEADATTAAHIADAGERTPPSIDRVRDDAGYAAGNLAVMSRRANHAKGRHGRVEALRIARALEAEPAGAMVDGLGAAEWARIATLCSFVEPLPHAEAAALPLRVLPPNRLRLFNPVQALQAFVSRQFLKPGWSQRIAQFEALLPAGALRHDFKSFFMTLLPRMIEAAGRAAGEPGPLRWAVEDAWRAPLVQQRWTRFALRLDADACEALLARATAGGLATAVVMPLTGVGATDGWALETRGYVPHAPATRTAAARQQQLGW